MTPPAPSQRASAKVNLFLHVGAKRRDGYHDLCSLVVFPEVGDVIAVSTIDVIPGDPGLDPGETRDPSISSQECLGSRSFTNGSRLARQAPLGRDDGKGKEVCFEIEGPFAGGLDADDSNLVLRAARALRNQALAMGRAVGGAKIVLTKNLPIASGIGGGSADAAATLRLLNDLWSLRLSNAKLREIALGLGSDVPVCIDSRPQWMEGRGERVTRGPRLPEVHLALVNPGVPVPTAGVFKALKKKSGANRPSAPKSFASARSLAAWLSRNTCNDLQDPAIEIAPQIADVLAALEAQPGCLLARMSGSGATCLGVFDNARDANRAANAMPRQWWAQAARV